MEGLAGESAHRHTHTHAAAVSLFHFLLQSSLSSRLKVCTADVKMQLLYDFTQLKHKLFVIFLGVTFSFTPHFARDFFPPSSDLTRVALL